MIITVTPNPSVDRTLRVPALRRGEVLRATTHRTDAGGKGVNVALALMANGGKARAVVLTGGPEGRQLEALLHDAGLDIRTVDVSGSIRANVSVVEPDGTVTKINEPGPTLDDRDLATLLGVVTAAADGADWVATCGSLPPGAPEDLHARIVEVARVAGARSAVDSSGAAFTAALRARPDLVKPNRDELAEAVGHRVDTVGDAQDAALQLIERGAGSVLATLGSAGALLVTADEAAFAAAPRIDRRSDVGAGDATLAGYLLAAGESLDRALAAAVAAGAAAAATAGSRTRPTNDVDLDAIEVQHDIPRARRL